MMLPLLLALAVQLPGDWPVYGRDAGGARFSPLTQITRANVAQLQVAWTYHASMLDMSGMDHRPPALEVTPIVVDGAMYVITPTGIVAALDPATGTERWRYDAGVNPHRGYGDFASRGVSFWRDSRAAPGAVCARRVVATTIDARLVSLDAATGKPCAGFGSGGVVDLRKGLRVTPDEFAFYEVTSPPAIVGDLIITGSAIADNTNLAPASGEVRAWDARTGSLKWSFDPIPQDSTDPAFKTWEKWSAPRTGGGNVWSVMAVDPERDLVFLPTSSPAPDYFGGMRLGENRYANSIVALRASTGKVVWHFQTSHHDIWDYDNAAPPALTTATLRGAKIPVVIQVPKTGMMYVLDRQPGNRSSRSKSVPCRRAACLVRWRQRLNRLRWLRRRCPRSRIPRRMPGDPPPKSKRPAASCSAPCATTGRSPHHRWKARSSFPATSAAPPGAASR